MKRKNVNLEKENEQFRILANKLKDYKSQNKNCLAFISIQKRQGETYIIQKMAEILASSSQKTLILDFDFLENTLTKYNNLDHEPGVLELVQYIQPSQPTPLLDTIEVGTTINSDDREIIEQNIIYKVDEPLTPTSSLAFNYGKTLFKQLAPCLYILPSGTMDTLEQHITLPERELGEIFEVFRENFDYILVEMPSLEHLSYTQILTRLVDEALIVIKPGTINKSSANEISKKIESLGCGILGSVLTKTKRTF